MQGVPPQFSDEKDRARFRHLEQLPGVELYHAHISRYAFEPHTHEAFGIGVIEQGAERFRYRGSQHIAAANAIVTMNPDELHTGEAETADGWLWHSEDALAQQGMLLDLIDAFRPLAHHASAQGEAGHRFDRVRDYLHDNYMRPITLDELAQVAALSPYHFQRQFKAHYHVTPHQMLMAIRLWRAKAFLTHGMPAAEVAIAVGLTDQSHLTRAVTQRYGITPVRYQKQVARR